MLTTVILCGGSGTRLWPLSRETYPKQFLKLASNESLLADTIGRVGGIHDPDTGLALATRLSIVSNEEHRFLVAATVQATGVQEARIVLEPVARNTAPAIALAALAELEVDPDALLLVLPADHVIRDPVAFRAAVARALPLARDGRLVTFGIVPDSAHTGYGYIRADIQEGWAAVQAFVEKPDAATAQRYLDTGGYFWNSGMFLFRAQTYLEELEHFRPEMAKACRLAWDTKTQDLDFLRVEREAFARCPDDSVDYAVMENTERAVVVPLDAGWSDVGSWSTLWEIQDRDAHGNVTRGDVISEDTEGCYIHSEGRLVATLGLRDQVIVETDDVVMVTTRERVQDIKKLVARVKSESRDEHRFHRRVHRPWGSYEGIARADRFQVKRIMVKPGSKLSLQKHHHRAEHWVVVQGTGLVTRGDEQILLTEDQSTYIPLGMTHRLENPGVIPLELIEIQTGAYLGEDDIVRYDDTYGRA